MVIQANRLSFLSVPAIETIVKAFEKKGRGNGHIPLRTVHGEYSVRITAVDVDEDTESGVTTLSFKGELRGSGVEVRGSVEEGSARPRGWLAVPKGE
jgi:hypothetical protein